LKLPSYFSIGAADKEERRPWAYFSGYDGQGYRPDDCNLPSNATDDWFEALDKTTYPSTAASQQFQCKYLAPTGGNFFNCESMAPNPYCTGVPLPTAGTPINWQNPNGYQLVSTGGDGKYGPGGQIPRPKVGADAPPTASYIDLSNAGSSFDNVTNVSGSARLGEFNERQGN
jgi:hypothetical protein